MKQHDARKNHVGQPWVKPGHDGLVLGGVVVYSPPGAVVASPHRSFIVMARLDPASYANR